MRVGSSPTRGRVCFFEYLRFVVIESDSTRMFAQPAQSLDATPTQVTFGDFVQVQCKAPKAKEIRVETSNPYALLDESEMDVVVAPVTPKAKKPVTAKKSAMTLAAAPVTPKPTTGMTWAEKLELQSVLLESDLIGTLETPK